MDRKKLKRLMGGKLVVYSGPRSKAVHAAVTLHGLGSIRQLQKDVIKSGLPASKLISKFVERHIKDGGSLLPE